MIILQQSNQLGILNGHKFPVTSIAFSPDGEALISGGDDTVRLWSLISRKEIRTLRGHSGNWLESAVTSVAVSPNGKFIASSGTDNIIRIWYLKHFLKSNRGRIVTLTGHSQGSYLARGVRSVAFSSDGKILASGGSDRAIKLWDTATWKEISTLNGYPDAITSIAFSPVEKTLIGASSNTIKLWKLDTGDDITFTTPSTPRSLSFNTNGQSFASGGLKGSISLWILNTGEEMSTDRLHSEEITCVAFSSDGRFFATGSYDQKIKLWNATTQELISTFTGHTEAVYSLAFCPDSSILASGSADKTIRLWKIP